MKSNNEKDPLWDLLGSASKQKPDAFFSRNVMREVRHQPVKSPWWNMLGIRHAVLATSCAALAITFVSKQQIETQGSSTLAQHSGGESIEVTDVLHKIELSSLSDEELDYEDILNPISLVAHLDTSEFDDISELLEL